MKPTAIMNLSEKKWQLLNFLQMNGQRQVLLLFFKERHICIKLLLHFPRIPGHQHSDYTRFTQEPPVLFSPCRQFALQHSVQQTVGITLYLISVSRNMDFRAFFDDYSQSKRQKDAYQCLFSWRQKPTVTFSPQCSVTFFNYWKAEQVTG